MKPSGLLWVAVLAVFSIAGCALTESLTTTTTTALSAETTSTTTSTTSTTSTSTTSTSTTTSSTTTTVVVPLHVLVGTWSGTWEDTVYDLSGNLNATITQDGAVLSGSGTIALASLGFAGITTELVTLGGAISGSNVLFLFDAPAPTVSSGNGLITNLTMTGTGDVGGAINYGAFTLIGTIEPGGNAFNMYFDYLSPTGGLGTVRMIKQ